jgi:hypothetical protein
MGKWSRTISTKNLYGDGSDIFEGIKLAVAKD